jgi:hypothetical protein
MNLYRHKKTGGVYAVLIENAVIESDQTPCVVYQGVESKRHMGSTGRRVPRWPI